jgi:hypothetical protein
MGRVYRNYRCDHGHDWEVERDSDEPEHDEDAQCAFGHEAVTRTDQIPVDEIQVLIRPAARIVDSITGQVGLEGRYWVVLLDPSDGELRRSSRHYVWEEAVQLARVVRGKDERSAVEWWDEKDP